MVPSPHNSSRPETGQETFTWRPEVAAQAEQIVIDVIELADADTLDLLPSSVVVQEVLDTLDEHQVVGQNGREGAVL